MKTVYLYFLTDFYAKLFLVACTFKGLDVLDRDLDVSYQCPRMLPPLGRPRIPVHRQFIKFSTPEHRWCPAAK